MGRGHRLREALVDVCRKELIESLPDDSVVFALLDAWPDNEEDVYERSNRVVSLSVSVYA